ncbi:Ger(x)C family spore germination protein [Virgibacillus salexigens]|uniref:Ger(x)C family spore germination protein n=1 Tax=Virgibacillus massiliensis TaxID=1462526 RepID=UPI001367A04D|nr:Ger(x)C family spore germination protein [Virgibacillus massiliensis]MYL42873.1 Ger(x)C family spore germination protein [Virgibacillus massiliensis]
MKNKLIMLLCFIPILLLSGCLETKPIERLAIINARGIDLLDEGLIDTTLVMFQFDTQSPDISKIASGSGKTIKEARYDANTKTSFTLTPGQIRLELYGKDVAEKGIISYLNTLVRDARTSDRVLLAITDSSAKEIITQGQQATNINVGLFMSGLIKQKIENDSIPKPELYDFTHAFFEKGQDPVLPLISSAEGTPALSSMAMFKDDVYVGKLSLDQAILINMFLKTIHSTPFDIGVDAKPLEKYLQNFLSGQDNETIQLNGKIIKGRTNTKIVDPKQLKFQTDVTIQMNLLELSRELDLANEEVTSTLEEQIEKQVKKQYEELLTQTQKMKADPFGYGEIYRINKNNGELKRDQWHELYPEIDVDYKVDVKIVEYGTIR